MAKDIDNLLEERRNQCVTIFKRFKRFLKEEGRYRDIMRYLFPPGRTENDFIQKWVFITTEGYENIPLYILNQADLLGPSYTEKGYTHWCEHIRELAKKWNKLNGLTTFN